MIKIWLGRFALMLTPVVITAGIMEVVLRSQVPRNGITPFQNSTIDDLPHQLRPSFTTTYKGVEVTSNSLGFRGPEPPKRKPGIPRIAIVGDSVAYGQAIVWNETLSVQLEAKLLDRNVEAQVLNCAVPGYCADDIRAMFEHQVLPLDADTYVYLFVSNDVVRSPKKRDIPPDAVINPFHGYPMGSAFLQWTGVRVKGLLRGLGREDSGGWSSGILAAFENGGRDRLSKVLIRMKNLAERDNRRFLVASYPFLTKPSVNPFKPIEQACEELCAELNIPFWNLNQVFDEEENLAMYWANPFDSHPNREANHRISALLADILIEQNFLADS